MSQTIFLSNNFIKLLEKETGNTLQMFFVNKVECQFVQIVSLKKRFKTSYQQLSKGQKIFSF
jgi:hypothetical protein